MTKLKELKKQVKSLSARERTALKAFLSHDSEEMEMLCDSKLMAEIKKARREIANGDYVVMDEALEKRLFGKKD